MSDHSMARKQRGATLFIALIMLVMLTLFALSAIGLSNVNLRIVGNQQVQKMMDAAAQDGIEQSMSAAETFGTTAAARTFTVNGFSVSVAAATCIYSSPADDSAKLSNAATARARNDFELVATVTDLLSGARAVIHQGARMVMLAGNC